ncbi:conserved hypothetical protein [Frankia canadensis]|uniref:Uncharacterized protein n=1 Tax=Frankia canadensis TaxID=1836972 RepID=A0A2I2KVH6_9ACTN|nr:hypothetical protein [Frankia canadensis]SNQ49669.1 conserved hypothetical protein [Frankia canadensis]SOU56959.1 conserved hypothetical protein [Frankia canadensis]
MEQMMFAAAVRAVNDTLARRSAHHGGLPCPEGARAVRGGVLGCCDLGCLDDAITLLERVLSRLVEVGPGTRPGAGGAVPHGYLTRVVRSSLGDLHRERRRDSGMQQRPERVPDAAWARRALPDPADRALLAHLMTWLGSDVPAVPGTGWPLRAWAERYGTTPARMADRIRRVTRAVEAASPERYRRYLARPLADKAPVVLPFSALRGADVPVDGPGRPVAGERVGAGARAAASGGGRREPARPLWAPTPPSSAAADLSAAADGAGADRRIAAYRLAALAAQAAGLHGTGQAGVHALRAALVGAFGPAAAGVGDTDLAAVLCHAAAPTGPRSGAGPAVGAGGGACADADADADGDGDGDGDGRGGAGGGGDQRGDAGAAGGQASAALGDLLVLAA